MKTNMNGNSFFNNLIWIFKHPRKFILVRRYMRMNCELSIEFKSLNVYSSMMNESYSFSEFYKKIM